MANAPFKVLVVGGGPVGLTMALALHHAGIDFLVLERGKDVGEDVGASLVISPHNLRVFHQFGLLDKIMGIGVPFLHHSEAFSPRARSFNRCHALGLLQDNHGCSLMAFHRAHLIRTLYENLPVDVKDRYLMDKKATKIEVTANGVEVCCADDSSYSGSIVVGADGVHSQVRSTMRRLALETDKSQEANWDAEVPFTSHYKCVWASFPRTTEPGESYETQGQGRAIMYLTGVEKGWIFLYERLAQPTNQRVKYDEKDIAAFAGSFADWQVHEKLKVRDIFAGPYVAGMANLEEGIAENMSWGGRLVLVGDACHKFTPNAGLGFNNGVQDVTSLCNHLEALLASRPLDDGTRPSSAALQEVFYKYQQERREPLLADLQRSEHAIRLQTWASRLYYFLARYVLSNGYVQRLLANYHTGKIISKGLVLKYITAPEPLSGKIPWRHPLPS